MAAAADGTFLWAGLRALGGVRGRWVITAARASRAVAGLQVVAERSWYLALGRKQLMVGEPTDSRTVFSPSRACSEAGTLEELLIACLQRQVTARKSHGSGGWIRAVRFLVCKSLKLDFDYARELRGETIAHLGTLDLVTSRDNVVFLDLPGTGQPTSPPAWRSAPAGSAAFAAAAKTEDQQTCVEGGSRRQGHLSVVDTSAGGTYPRQTLVLRITCYGKCPLGLLWGFRRT